MARLKELRRWSRNGKFHVSLKFVSGKMIAQHTFATPEEALQMAAKLSAQWSADLISRAACDVHVTRLRTGSSRHDLE